MSRRRTPSRLRSSVSASLSLNLSPVPSRMDGKRPAAAHGMNGVLRSFSVPISVPFIWHRSKSYCTASETSYMSPTRMDGSSPPATPTLNIRFASVSWMASCVAAAALDFPTPATATTVSSPFSTPRITRRPNLLSSRTSVMLSTTHCASLSIAITNVFTFPFRSCYWTSTCRCS